MAVQNEDSYKRYAANGVATVYAIPFLLLAKADLQIALNGVVMTVGFTIAGVGTNTGSVTFDEAPTGDLLLQRVVPFERLTDYQDNGDLLSGTVNRDFDRLWLAVQELRRDDFGALRVGAYEPEGIPALPTKDARKLKLLGFDSAGIPIPSNLTLEELERQPELASGYAQQSQVQAAAAASFASDAQTQAAQAALHAAASQDAAGAASGFADAAAQSALEAAEAVPDLPALEARINELETNRPFTKQYVSAQQSITAGGLITLTHSLGGEPKLVQVTAVCVVADAGWPAGKVIQVGGADYGPTWSAGVQIMPSASTVELKVGVSGISIINSAGAIAALAPASWRLVVRAFR